MFCCAPLSNFEVGYNHKDTDDLAVWVSFSLVDDSTVKLVAWTLSSNLALCINPNSIYVKIHGLYIFESIENIFFSRI